MTSPAVPLLVTNLRTWVSAKGFWLVAAAALLPLVLTGVWVTAHRADVTAVEVEVPDTLVAGTEATFRAFVENTGPTTVDSVNVTLAVGIVNRQTRTIMPDAVQSVEMESLAPGERREVTLSWTPIGGARTIALIVDPLNDLGEVDEHDNIVDRDLVVSHQPGGGAPAPTAPETVRGDEDAAQAADFAVTSLRRSDAKPGEEMTLEAVVENRGADAGEARVVVTAYETFAGQLYPTQQATENVTLAPGESRSVALRMPVREGGWWQQAYVEPPAGAREETPDDNHVAEPFAVAPAPAERPPVEIPERQTIKEFYLAVLGMLHLRLLLPFMALFYAAGVIVDERERGSLAYVLTRPVPRWLVPLTKFAASFAVAALAAIVGLVLTYFLLFQATPEGRDAGFFLTPILIGVLALFAYGALFTLMGVWARRPYLVGVAWVLGWELIAFEFAEWVRRLTVRHYIDQALAAWPLDEGLLWLPTGEGGTRAIVILLLGSIGMLAAASVMMKKREFDL